MKSWLLQQLDALDVADAADPGGQWFDASVVAREAADKAARAGLGYRVWPDGAPIPEVKRYLSELIGATDKPSADSLLTLPQAASLLGYRPAGLRKLVKSGAIQYAQNGQGPIRFKREWLDQFIASKQSNERLARSPAQKRTKRPTATPRFGFDPELFL